MRVATWPGDAFFVADEPTEDVQLDRRLRQCESLTPNKQ
jgi:hypothetical protein